MVMRNVKNAHFWQVDNKIKNIFTTKGIIVLPSSQAWEKFNWTRKFFKKKPKEGYFIWVKEKINFPLTTCVSIASKKTVQNLTNLLIIERNLKVKINVVCNALKKNLCAKHKAQGKLVLKEGAGLEYTHNHLWGEKDFVNTDYEFILGKRAKLVYNYKTLFPPKNLSLKTTIFSKDNSSSNLNFIINGLNSKIDLTEAIFLKGNNSQGIIKLRLIGRKNSKISGKSSIVATAPGKGHLDCQGLLVGKNSVITFIPKLICAHPKAQITHEASIGKISEEELNYLRMRGLTEKEAIDLIISGFLQI